MYNQILFTNILRALDEEGITKYELANRANVSSAFLGDLTKGKANPSLRTMEAIADALGKTLPYLLESNDLDQNALKELAGGKVLDKMPEGYVRKSVLLTDYQAFVVEQWDEANRKKTSSQRKNDSSTKPIKKRKVSKAKLKILNIMRNADHAVSTQDIALKLLELEGGDVDAHAIYKNIYVNTHIRALQKLGFVVLSKEKKLNKQNRQVSLWELVNETEK